MSLNVKQTIYTGITVGVGVGIALRVIDAIADYLPTWLSWLGKIATTGWGYLSVDITVEAWFFVLVLMAGLRTVVDFFPFVQRNNRREAAQFAASRHSLVEHQPKHTLSNEELVVFRQIVLSRYPMDLQDIHETVSLTPLRITYALELLRGKGLIILYDDNYTLTSEGRALAVQQDLDKTDD